MHPFKSKSNLYTIQARLLQYGTLLFKIIYLFKMYALWHSEDRASWYILIIKTHEMHYFSNLFWYRTLHVSDRSTVHHQESSTVYTAIGICHTGYADCLLAGSGCSFLISLTYSMEQSPSWEANWSAASQEIPRILWNPKVHHRTHKRTPPVPILS